MENFSLIAEEKYQHKMIPFLKQRKLNYTKSKMDEIYVKLWFPHISKEQLCQCLSEVVFDENNGYLMRYALEQADELTIQEKTKLRKRILETIERNKIVLQRHIYWDMEQMQDLTYSLHIKGYLYFGAKHLKEYIKQLTEEICGIFAEQRQLRQYAFILRDFLNSHKPMIQKADILLQDSEAFTLIDENGRDLKTEYAKRIAPLNPEKPLDRENEILAILLTIVPQKVILHTGERSLQEDDFYFFRTIFAERLSIEQ